MSDRDFLLTPFATCAGVLNKDDEFIKNDVTDVAKCCLNFCEPQITFCNNKCKKHLNKIFKKQLENPNVEQKIGWYGKYKKDWKIKDWSNLGYYSFNSTWNDRLADSTDIASEPLFTSPEFLEKRCEKSCSVLRDTCLGNCRLVDKLTTDFNLYNNCAQKFALKNTKNNKDDRGTNTPDKDTIIKNKKEIMECCLLNCEKQTENFDCKKYCNFYQDLIINPESISPEYKKIIKSEQQKNKRKKYKLYRDNSFVWILSGLIFGIIIAVILVFLLKK